MGVEEHLGTLEPGKLAEIVLLDANPLEDIKNTQTIWRVIKGRWVPSAIEPLQGCPFASRCPEVQDICRRVAPALELKATGHVVACHFR